MAERSARCFVESGAGGIGNLNWIQFHWAGIDHAIDAPILQKPELVATHLSGAAASQLAEYALMLLLALSLPSRPWVLAQQPTGSVPTVTGTPTGPVVAVDPSLDYIDVYAGPGSFDYPAIGVLVTGVKVPALGRARGNDNWIMIRYVGVPESIGWVYALQVSLNRRFARGLMFQTNYTWGKSLDDISDDTDGAGPENVGAVSTYGP